MGDVVGDGGGTTTSQAEKAGEENGGRFTGVGRKKRIENGSFTRHRYALPDLLKKFPAKTVLDRSNSISDYDGNLDFLI